ncbi:ABC transporter ATP-binding protein [Aureimonas sp. SA4125]|uniref:ABC transporter ATP-binding protein n=1 Tax=Aureimonas sp. SA4125 TaxID=2826993 RepID=UPI001CC36BDD|nr:ABC transporter ATP-binding protein [Aureimonas sp. SA4125]BDA83864.1 ABC transporter ATP-binding protein [Aureimonas sp. SA4125]
MTDLSKTAPPFSAAPSGARPPPTPFTEAGSSLPAVPASSPSTAPIDLDVHVAQKRFVSADGTDMLAIDDFAFTAPRGSFTALIGPSGCGKTTALRIILGLDTDFSGHVRRADPAGRIAAVFQEPRLLPWRDVETNVRLALPPERRGDDLSPLFETLGLTEMTKRFPGELSLGLARRVALARAFAIRPALLLLDEPFVSLDEPTAARLRTLLLDVWSARPTTAVMVTHNLREAVELADRIVFLTERPARLRGIHDLPTPRAERDAEWRERTLAMVSALYPGVT